ncbi:MAG TPA: 6-phosphogluconolactonase [Acidimicrobiales bacterium]|nr:6-phosphogluconolactonase [Acidimicrobiales bacterium]
MHHDLIVFDDLDALSDAAARYVADRARAAVADDGTFHFAVSGGRSPWQMFGVLTTLDVPWDRTVIWQVDERVAPEADPERNLAHLRDALGDKAADVRPMPVEDEDLDAAAARYGAALPREFHLVHLGIGPDGHTASLVPGDPVLEVRDRPVAVTASAYQGRRRMTLTYPGIERARQLLWLVSGEDKRGALEKLLAADPSVPAGRVEAGSSIVMADRAAAPTDL